MIQWFSGLIKRAAIKIINKAITQTINPIKNKITVLPGWVFHFNFVSKNPNPSAELGVCYLLLA